MAVKFNPFTGQLQLDQVGAGGGGGGGSSYLDGEVATYADLFLDGTAAINSAWLVREASGVWPVSRKQAGIYIRTATAGSSRDADYTYAGTMPDVFSDSVFLLYDEASTTRTGQFNLGNITAGQNRVLSWPNASGTIALTSDISASVTSVTGTAPIVSSGGATPAISINAATTSSDGSMSSADKTKLNGIAAGAEVNVQANWTEADSNSDAFILNKPSTFAPSSHSSSHASSGSDPVSPASIGAQSIFSVESLVITTTSQVTLTAARAKIYDIVQYAGAQVDVKLPSTNAIEGDIVVMRWGTGGDSIRIIQSASGSPITTVSSGEQKRFIRGATDNWTLVPVDTHTHAASAITSGTLTHERGGLEADVSAYSGLVKISGGSTSAVTVTSAGEALLDDADAAAQRTTLGLGTAATAATGDFAAASHSHGNLTSDGKLGSTSGLCVVTTTAGAVTTLALGTANQVLRVNSGATGVEFGTVSGGVTAVGASTADVLSVSGSDLVADDGGTIDSSDPFIKWDDANSKLVYANPLSRPSGAFYVGLAPSTTALGSNAINVQATRTNAADVASGSASVCIGTGSIRASGNESIAMGVGSFVNGLRGVGIGYAPTASGTSSICITGLVNVASGVNSAGINGNASLRAQFATLPFSAVYWSGQTTTNAATILNLDGTATNRFTIAASTALAVDILLVARRATTQDKWLVARRFLGIRRDGSNNTSLIGAVQTLGTDQSEGSPTWTFALTADDTNEALQLEVTGATGETVEWRATAFYRVA